MDPFAVFVFSFVDGIWREQIARSTEYPFSTAIAYLVVAGMVAQLLTRGPQRPTPINILAGLVWPALPPFILGIVMMQYISITCTIFTIIISSMVKQIRGGKHIKHNTP